MVRKASLSGSDVTRAEDDMEPVHGRQEKAGPRGKREQPVPRPVAGQGLAHSPAARGCGWGLEGVDRERRGG